MDLQLFLCAEHVEAFTTHERFAKQVNRFDVSATTRQLFIPRLAKITRKRFQIDMVDQMHLETFTCFEQPLAQVALVNWFTVML